MFFTKIIITCALCLQLGHLQLVSCATRDSAREKMEKAERSRAGDGGSGQVTSGTNQAGAASGLEPVEYLKRFGYLPEQSSEQESSAKVLERAVGKFQSYMGVYQSNIIDSITTKHMKRARCGNKDILPNEPEQPVDEEENLDEENTNENRQQERGEDARWQTKLGQLSYKIVNYPSRLRNRKADVDEIFKQAFGTWEAVVPIKFEKRTTGDANFDIHFIADEHECPAGPLHRAGGDTPILAHAFGPPKVDSGFSPKVVVAPEDTLDGDIHFNDHILWIVDNGSTKVTKSGQSLLAAAIHQIGHALGLSHNRLLGSKMFPIEAGQVKLNESDKMRIQQIYNPKRKVDSFFAIENRRLPDLVHEWKEVKNIVTLDECIEYANKNRINLTVWDRNRQVCAAKSIELHPSLTLYSSAGIRLDNYNVRSYDQDTSELESDVSQWISSRQCDIILRLLDWPIKGRISYKCKVFKEDDCCVMLFRIGRDRSQPDLLGDKQTRQGS